MALSDAAIRSVKTDSKAYKFFDDGGLFLLVSPSGSRLWHLKYRQLGKENQLAIGTYPDISLKQARELRDEARKKLAIGIDPNAARKREVLVATLAAASTFNAVALEFCA